MQFLLARMSSCDWWEFKISQLSMFWSTTLTANLSAGFWSPFLGLITKKSAFPIFARPNIVRGREKATHERLAAGASGCKWWWWCGCARQSKTADGWCLGRVNFRFVSMETVLLCLQWTCIKEHHHSWPNIPLKRRAEAVHLKGIKTKRAATDK